MPFFSRHPADCVGPAHGNGLRLNGFDDNRDGHHRSHRLRHVHIEYRQLWTGDFRPFASALSDIRCHHRIILIFQLNTVAPSATGLPTSTTCNGEAGTTCTVCLLCNPGQTFSLASAAVNAPVPPSVLGGVPVVGTTVTSFTCFSDV
jgi:hypothetical protein